MQNPIDGAEIQGMVSHWLRTPVNSYLGSDYGNTIPQILNRPMAAGIGDAIIAKLKMDIPALKLLPESTINLFARMTKPDQAEIVIAIGGSLIAVDSQGVVRGA